MPEQESKFRKLVKIANSIDFHFSEYARKLREEKVKARLLGQNQRFERIDTALRNARASVNEALDILEDEMLSTATVDELVNRLDGHASSARDLLKQMREMADNLKKIEDGAKLAAEVLKTIKQIVSL